MSRRRTLGPRKKLALLLSAATVAGGGAFVMATTSSAYQTAAPTTESAADSTVCRGLATALGNNRKFIEGRRADPDAQSEARIANREAGIAEIELKQWASGRTVGESAQDSRPARPEQPAQPAPGEQAGGGDAAQNPGGDGAAVSGEQVCNGSTVTLSGEDGAPAASSSQSGQEVHVVPSGAH